MDLSEIMSRLTEVIKSVPVHYRDGLLGSMTTQPHPVAKAAFDMFQNLNANDLELYGPVRELELEAIEELGSYVGCRGCTGYITSGGSESNLAALYLAREHGLENVYYAASAHHSIAKAARLLRMRARGLYVYRCGLVSGLRVVVMPHVTDELIDRFLRALGELTGRRGP